MVVMVGGVAGMVTAVVLTGVSSRADAEALAQPPDWIVADLDGLLALIR